MIKTPRKSDDLVIHKLINRRLQRSRKLISAPGRHLGRASFDVVFQDGVKIYNSIRGNSMELSVFMVRGNWPTSMAWGSYLLDKSMHLWCCLSKPRRCLSKYDVYYLFSFLKKVSAMFVNSISTSRKTKNGLMKRRAFNK